MTWIIQNIGSICVLLVVIAFVSALTYSLIKPKRSGKSSSHACSGCAGCAMAGKCKNAQLESGENANI